MVDGKGISKSEKGEKWVVDEKGAPMTLTCVRSHLVSAERPTFLRLVLYFYTFTTMHSAFLIEWWSV